MEETRGREKEGKEAQGEGDSPISGNCYHLCTIFHQATAHTLT